MGVAQLIVGVTKNLLAIWTRGVLPMMCTLENTVRIG